LSKMVNQTEVYGIDLSSTVEPKNLLSSPFELCRNLPNGGGAVQTRLISRFQLHPNASPLLWRRIREAVALPPQPPLSESKLDILHCSCMTPGPGDLRKLLSLLRLAVASKFNRITPNFQLPEGYLFMQLAHQQRDLIIQFLYSLFPLLQTNKHICDSKLLTFKQPNRSGITPCPRHLDLRTR
jgi:hypothetical protein